jgi:ABC-type glycerol-3-phosphate transport system substrate-binding protein
MEQAAKLKTALADRRPDPTGSGAAAVDKPTVPLMINFMGNVATLFNVLRAAVLGRDGISDLLYGEGRWDSPAMLRVAQTVVDFQREGIIPAQPLDQHVIGAANFTLGNAAWWPNGSWSVIGFENSRKNNPGQFDYNYFGMPAPDGSRSPQLVGRIVGGWTINRASSVRDEAAMLADFLISPPALKVWYSASPGELMGPVQPVNPTEFGLPAGFTAVLAGLINAGDMPQHIPENTSPTFGEALQMTTFDLVNGKISPQDFGRIVQAQWQQEKDAGKLPTFAR